MDEWSFCVSLHPPRSEKLADAVPRMQMKIPFLSNLLVSLALPLCKVPTDRHLSDHHSSVKSLSNRSNKWMTSVLYSEKCEGFFFLHTFNCKNVRNCRTLWKMSWVVLWLVIALACRAPLMTVFLAPALVSTDVSGIFLLFLFTCYCCLRERRKKKRGGGAVLEYCATHDTHDWSICHESFNDNVHLKNRMTLDVKKKKKKE